MKGGVDLKELDGNMNTFPCRCRARPEFGTAYHHPASRFLEPHSRHVDDTNWWMSAFMHNMYAAGCSCLSSAWGIIVTEHRPCRFTALQSLDISGIKGITGILSIQYSLMRDILLMYCRQENPHRVTVDFPNDDEAVRKVNGLPPVVGQRLNNFHAPSDARGTVLMMVYHPTAIPFL